MVVFGQCVCIRALVVVFVQKLLYSGKSGYIRLKWLYWVKCGCIRAKVVVFGQKGCIRVKVVVFV